MTQNRRQWLAAVSTGVSAGVTAGVTAGALPPKAVAQTTPSMSKTLDLSQFQPKSALHVKETRVERPRYPVIDVHTHLSFSRKSQNGVAVTGEPKFIWPAEQVLPTMDRKGIRAMVNLTGGFGSGLEDAVAKFDRAHA